MDQTDVSPLAAAMRETEEEIGLDRQFVDPIGYLDLRFAFSVRVRQRTSTRSGYLGAIEGTLC
jgi:8-oxo-dGTP pyrophosphatase MutT (NUDIX family)